MNKRIIVVIGRCCSGKDRFAQTLINHTQIDIGSIVRSIMKGEGRTHDKSLDTAITREVEYRIGVYNTMNFVITGIRQQSILDFLIKHFSQDLELIYLDVPEQELKRRYINRKAEKDKDLTFEEVLERDHDLGLGEIEKFIYDNQSLFTIINNY